ncbi:hypothetical protein [Pseudaestuariivita rosea]|uniref:hypothetical protein n=1 Tax=Pseudaestuariivita rosea TaxID=2763263 RepID=UPI001ABB56FD|nr:hypothetical protein [Pseudaestuariivita rosea]
MLDLVRQAEIKSRSFETWLQKRPKLWRWIFAGPVALILSILAMASLPFVLPAGRGGINHLVLPVVFFPVLWAGFVIFPVVSHRLNRIGGVYGGLTVLFILMIVIGGFT